MASRLYNIQVLHRSDSKNKMQKATPAPMARKTNADMTFEVVMAETVFDSQEVDTLRLLGSHFLVRTSIFERE